MLSFDIRSLEAQAATVDDGLEAGDAVWQEGDPKPDSAVRVTGRLSATASGGPLLFYLQSAGRTGLATDETGA